MRKKQETLHKCLPNISPNINFVDNFVVTYFIKWQMSAGSEKNIFKGFYHI